MKWLRTRQSSWLVILAAFLLPVVPACGPADGAPGDLAGGASTGGAADPETGSAAAPVRPGARVLVEDSLHLVRGLRAGLITNHTGLVPEPGGGVVTTIDLLHGHPEVELVALFGPEHGLRGEAAEGEHVDDGVDDRTGLPVRSLYGSTRRPDSADLADLDVLLFDILDIGSRYYTYVWTMSLAMEAAGEMGIPFVVLDRPNPLGGAVQGNVLDTAFATFVGLHPVAMRHGLTPGEMARLVSGAFGVEADLHVVPADGWRHDMPWGETGIPWVPPSPNMPSLESAFHYPGTCLFEGTNLSVGRGTDRAFQQVGAPWLDADAVVAALRARQLPGVAVDPVTFTPREPTDGKHGGEAVRGVRFRVTDAALYDPTVTAVAALVDARRIAGDRWEWNVAHFDRLAGTDALRLGIDAGQDVGELTSGWPAQLAAFRELSRSHLIYP